MRENDDDSSNVGYKRPPAEHQFKPGQSGNSKGRPRGRTNVANIVKAELNRPVSVRIGGKTQRMPAAKAILHALAAKSAAGEDKAEAALEKIHEMTGRTNEKTDEAREKTGMRLPGSFKQEESDVLSFSEARERDRQICWRLVDYEDEEQQTPAAAAIAAFIRTGDELERQGKLDEALAAYRKGLASCKEEIDCDQDNAKAQADFRRGVARIGLLADRLLEQGEFQRAIAFADAALAEGSTKYWVMPKLQYSWELNPTNTTWICAIRAHALMLSGNIDKARAFYKQFTSNKRLIETSWETSFLRDFIRLRKAGHSSPLMEEIEQHLAEEGWNTGVQNTKVIQPAMKGEDAVYVEMHPDDLRSGDLLLKFDQPDNAMKAYLGNLKKWAKNLERHPGRDDWAQNLAEAGDRVTLAIMTLLRAGRFITPLEYADDAISIAPGLLQLHLIRACSLMFVGKREDDARTLFLKYRGGLIGGKSWDDAVVEKFQALRQIRCGRSLMDEIERTFAATAAPRSLVVAPDEPISSTPSIRNDKLANASDIPAGDKLFANGRLDDALAVYLRRLRECDSMFAQGRIVNRTIDDRNDLVEKLSDLAFAYLLRKQYSEALAATDSYARPGATAGLPVLGIRRAHALYLLGQIDEANKLYRQCRGQKLDADRSADTLIAQDFERLREAGITIPDIEDSSFTSTTKARELSR